jgi:hypothetical protein
VVFDAYFSGTAQRLHHHRPLPASELRQTLDLVSTSRSEPEFTCSRARARPHRDAAGIPSTHGATSRFMAQSNSSSNWIRAS